MAEHRVKLQGDGCGVSPLSRALSRLNPGDVLEICADSPQFELQLRRWCRQMGLSLTAVNRRGDHLWAQVQI